MSDVHLEIDDIYFSLFTWHRLPVNPGLLIWECSHSSPRYNVTNAFAKLQTFVNFKLNESPEERWSVFALNFAELISANKHTRPSCLDIHNGPLLLIRSVPVASKNPEATV